MILVTEDVWGPAFAELAKSNPTTQDPDLWSKKEQLFNSVSQATALVVRNRTQVTEELILAAPQLKIIARAGVGLDNIDVAAADKHGVVVVAGLGANAISVGELTVGLALSLLRNIPSADHETKSGKWNRKAGRELAGLTWGLLGCGATGIATAQILSGFGVSLIGFDPYVKADDPRVTGLKIWLSSLDDVLKAADIISIHLPATKETYPTFDDVDRDGDMDMLDWPTTPDASVDFHINQSQQLGYGCDSLIFIQDAPCWGAFTMCLGTNQVCAFNALCKPAPLMASNSGKKVHPVFYFNPSDAAKKDDTLTSMLAIDLDGDDDTDLLVGDVGSPNSLAIFNGGTNQSANMNAQDTLFPSYNIPVQKHAFLQHAAFDINNDGQKDLLASAKRENYNYCTVSYLDTNTTASTYFVQSDTAFLQKQMIDFGRFAFPAVFDYDGDGLNDLIVGNEQYAPLYNGSIKTGLAVLRNTGTLQHPKFDLVNRNYADVNSLAFPTGGAAPAFGDLDGDNDKDLIIGSEDGKLYFYINNPIGSVANFTLSQPAYFNIDVGNYSIPQIVDLNNDGLNDLVAGRRNGTINYYQNTGTVTSATFIAAPTIDTLGNIILTVPPGVKGYAAPFFYNDNGTFKLYVACESGSVFEYGNINGNLSGTFSLVKTIISNSEGRNLNIGVGDLNGDNQEDLAVGNFDGGLSLYFLNVNVIGVQETDEVFTSVDVYPNPAKQYFSVLLNGMNRDTPLAISIFNAEGSLLIRTDHYKQGNKINTGALSNGIYMLRIAAGGKVIYRKVIIVK